MKINLSVSEPENVGEGMYKTKFTHPLLEGELWFFHGKNNQGVTLGAIQPSLADDISEVVTSFNDLKKGFK